MSSYGFASLDELLNAVRHGTGQPGLQSKWGWLALLLDAHSGDEVHYAAALTIPPFLDEGPHENMSDSTGKITIGGANLSDYTQNRLNRSMTWFIPWRNTKPTTYLLNGQQYIEASRPRDLPDFRIVNVDFAPVVLALAGWVPLAVCGKGIAGGASAAIDRYGNVFLLGFGGLQGSCLGYISAGEGYVARNPNSILSNQHDIPTATDIAETIGGLCVNAAGNVIIGLSISVCPNGATSATGFYTPGAGAAVQLSAGFDINVKLPSLAWDYIDRMPGISEADVIQRIISKKDCLN